MCLLRPLAAINFIGRKNAQKSQKVKIGMIAEKHVLFVL